MKTYTKTYSAKPSNKNAKKYMPFIFSPVIGILVIVILSFIFAAFQNKMYFEGLESLIVNIACYIISGTGAVVCGFICGKKSSVRGFIAGIISAIIIVIIKFIIALVLKETVFYIFDFIKLIEDFVLCTLAGIIGANKRNK